MTSDSSEELLRQWSGRDGITYPKQRAMRALISEYLSLMKEPAEGFTVWVEDPFNWQVALYGPPDTPYWGGYFKLTIAFPQEYPFEPPKLRFTEKFWHPNVYPDGTVCMSILHAAGDDALSGLAVDEKWNPTLSVRTVLLSLISLIGTPNPDSPANVDAAKAYRAWRQGEQEDYIDTVAAMVERSKATAAADGARVPRSLEEYCRPRDQSECLDIQPSDSSEDSDDELPKRRSRTGPSWGSPSTKRQEHPK